MFVLFQSAFAPVVENQVSEETSPTPPPDLPLDTIATGLTSVLPTVAAGALSELQSFPPIYSPADELVNTSTPKVKDAETKIEEHVAKKPFILLSQVRSYP